LTPTSISLSGWLACSVCLLGQCWPTFLSSRAAGRLCYYGVADYMQTHGVDGRLLALVILTELGGGLLVLFGLNTRWAAIVLFGFCLLTALFFHTGADQAIQLQKNVAMAGGFLALRFSALAPGRWTRGAPAPPSEGSRGGR
jgi:putative oxidoreductase